MATFTNNRTQETLSTDLSREQIAARFAEVAGENHWAWFWMLKEIQERSSRPDVQMSLTFIADMFLLAVGMGLKNPMHDPAALQRQTVQDLPFQQGNSLLQVG